MSVFMQQEGRTHSQKIFASGPVDVSWLLAARICVLGMALLVASWCSISYDLDIEHSRQLIFKPLALVFGYCALSAFWVIWRTQVGPIFRGLQLASDIVIISGIVYLTGGPISPFLFLYLPLVMTAAIFVSRQVALVTSFVSILAYSLLALAMLSGYIQPADGGQVVEAPTGGVVLQVLGLLSAMILTSVATTFLATKLKATNMLAQRSQQELSEVNSRQNALVEGIGQGVVATDLEGAIVNINQAACDLLKVSEALAVGKPLSAVTENLESMHELLSAPSDANVSKVEMDLVRDDSKIPLRIVCHRRPVLSASGEQSGTIFIFQDVTKLREIEEQFKIQERMARLLANKNEEGEIFSTKLSEFVGESPVMQKVFSLISRVAPSEATVLIHGESGTGKELVAKAIHLGGKRSVGPFVPVNCGAIPENLIESEFFGHKKGSFTGADSDYIGLFRQAEGGTIFLDEIGELPLHMQSKLLRAIQEKNVHPVGGNRDIPINVRIIAATNKNLKKEVEEKRFREDLFYRLNVINLQLPSLHERKDDIPLLVNSILKNLVPSDRIPIVPPATMQLLMSYNYPGNVRELENILERAVVLGGEAILAEHLPDTVRAAVEGDNGAIKPKTGKITEIIVTENLELPVNLDEILSCIERRYLEVALVNSNGGKKKAADLLGVNFRSFRYRLQKFGMDREV